MVHYIQQITNNMNIAFRVDSSSKIGTGHVIRCMTLATQLKNLAFNVYFICKPMMGDIVNSIKSKGYDVILLNSADRDDESDDFSVNSCNSDSQQVIDLCSLLSLDLIILDHYFLNYSWEKAVKDHSKLMCISDFPAGPRACDILLDSSLSRDHAEYRLDVSSDCLLMTGSDYVMVRPEFALSRSLGAVSKQVSKILVTMGGADPQDYTSRIIKIISQYEAYDLSNIQFDIVLGRSYQFTPLVLNLISTSKFNYVIHEYIDDMAGLMKDMDVIIAAAGTTLWECFSLGIPTIAVQIADNQQYNVDSCSRAGAIIPINQDCDLESSLIAALGDVLGTNNIRHSLRDNGLNICDGQGAKRVAENIRGAIHE
jgi:UDP-2,4-diacetamido-2,4,6-trideoxy-beta-L-altropyranose hydrolase